jgi:hypothetical protein
MKTFLHTIRSHPVVISAYATPPPESPRPSRTLTTECRLPPQGVRIHNEGSRSCVYRADEGRSFRLCRWGTPMSATITVPAFGARPPRGRAIGST